MALNSAAFLFMFLPLLFILCRVLPKGRRWLLAAGSLLFYAFGSLTALPLLLCAVLLNLLVGRQLAKGGGKGWLLLGLGFNLGALLFYKYLGFLLGLFGLVWDALALPPGLSFFTFQAISYLLDVYRGDTQALRSPLDMTLYLALFPRLLSGPLQRCGDFTAQLAGKQPDAEGCAAPLRRFTVGLAKKLLLAESLRAVADGIFALSPAALNAPAAWLGAIAYTLQLYFDFSGYTDMAIGVGGLFGFTLPENFDRPYTAVSLTDFWRRWHITLSRWFRDYVYIPLGGNRRGQGRTALNKLCVFLLTGLWHGAGWTFLLWGLWHGAFMMLESACRPFADFLKRHRLLGRVYTLLVVVLGFVLFRAESLGAAWGLLSRLFAFAPSPEAALTLTRLLDGAHIAALLGGAALSLLPRLPAREKWLPLRNFAALLLLLLSLLALAGGGFSPFIYARF